jgi:endo-1,4-beta-xylanase
MRLIISLLTILALISAVAQEPTPTTEGTPGEQTGTLEDVLPAGLTEQDTLRRVAPKGFHVGVAVAGGGHHEEMGYPDPFPNDTAYRQLLAAEFSSLTPENQLKWEFVHPEQGRYNFGPADAIVEFAQRNDQVVRGHTLLWHSQNPAWLEEGDFSPEELEEILRDHIFTVVGRYAGRIQQWDVANEIFLGDGSLRIQDNIWIRELGPDIITQAFRWAHEADPAAQLFFNDYGVDGINAKSTAYYELIRELLADGVPVHGFGTQSHLGLQWGFPGDLQANLQRFDDLGVATAITEIDVRMVLPDNGRPTDDQLERQADYFRQALQACLEVDGCQSYTVWGLTDRYSWVPRFFPDQGAATITWDDFTRKPAYYALQQTLAEAAQGGAQR